MLPPRSNLVRPSHGAAAMDAPVLHSPLAEQQHAHAANAPSANDQIHKSGLSLQQDRQRRQYHRAMVAG